MTRADEVRRLAEALERAEGQKPGWQSIAAALYDAGARMPEPPAPRKPVSRETAEAIRYTYAHERKGLTDADCLARAIWFHAPSLVADLAEAAKDRNGLVFVPGLGRCTPAALVAALTRADAGGA